MLLECIVTAGIHCLFVKPVHHSPDRYRWINVVLEDPKGITDYDGNKLQTPYIDPPPGGFKYGRADNDKYYWDNDDCEYCRTRYKASFNRDGNKYEFQDYPNDHRLKPGQKIKFRTCIVDTYNNDKELSCVKWNWVRQKGAFGRSEIVEYE